MEDGKTVEPDIWADGDDKVKMQKRTYDQTLAYLEKLVPGVSKNV